MRVPFLDLKAQNSSVQSEIEPAINEIIANCAFIGGKATSAFEAEFAAFCDVKYAIGVGNGTDALHLALLAAGVRGGAEVITVSHTFTATAEAIVNVGARPIFVDVDQTYTMDLSQVEACITPYTRAIIAVHLYGQPADMDPLMALAEKHGLVVIEDAAQAQGARYKGRRVGSLGHIACFSFYPGKNLGAFGDAGAIVTNNAAMAQQIRILHDHGRIDKYVHAQVGVNSRLDAIQAAVLRVKLRYLDQWNERRRQHAGLYNELLADVAGVVTPYVAPEVESIYHLYVVQVPDRDQTQTALKEAGIDTGIHYPIPLHEQPAYTYLEYNPKDLPTTNALGPCILSLPMFAELTEEQIRYVADTLRHVVDKY